MHAIRLQAVLIGTKGGPGSGNRGHAGRPGKLGGSVGKGAAGVEFTDGFPQKFTDIFGLTQQDMSDMFAVDGLITKIKVDEPKGAAGSSDVHVDWEEDRDGFHIPVANAERYFMLIDGEKVCNNSILGIGVQNTGLGSTLYAQQIAVLKARNFSAISTHANSDIGKYAWARQGFVYDGGQKVADAKTERFRKWTAKKGIPLDPNFKATTPQDFANFKVPGLKLSGAQITNSSVPDTLMMEVGKAFMLDQAPNAHADWDGILMLK